jgi:CubicO group peptidase (beta-lactamase class C family)
MQAATSCAPKTGGASPCACVGEVSGGQPHSLVEIWPEQRHKGCDRLDCAECRSTAWSAPPAAAPVDLLSLELRSLPAWDIDLGRYMHPGCAQTRCPVCRSSATAWPLPSPGEIAAHQRAAALGARLRVALKRLHQRRGGASLKVPAEPLRLAGLPQVRMVEEGTAPKRSGRRRRSADGPPSAPEPVEAPTARDTCFPDVGEMERIVVRRWRDRWVTISDERDDDGDGGVAAAIMPLIRRYMVCNNIPNMSVAVADRWGRIIHCHGYTNTEAYIGGDEVQYTTPWSTFRLASVTKLLTSIAMMQLAEAAGRTPPPGSKHDEPPKPAISPPGGDLLNVSVKGLLAEVLPLSNSTVTDPAGEFPDSLTIRHLLCHQGGWIRDIEDMRDFWPDSLIDYLILKDVERGWPYFTGVPSEPWEAKKYLDSERRTVSFPMSMEAIREVTDSHLTWGQFLRPGVGGFYSNWGFLLAGSCLERLSLSSYEAHIQAHVGAPVGARGLRMSHETLRNPGEMNYYNDDPGAGEDDCEGTWDGGPPLSLRKLSMVRSVITGPTDDQPCVRSPDGGYVITGRYGSSAMTASALDLILILRDLASADPRLLSRASVDRMATAQPVTLGQSFGLGFDTAESPRTGAGQLRKSGHQRGTRTLVIIDRRRGEPVYRSDGIGGSLVFDGFRPRWNSGLSLCLLTNKDGWDGQLGGQRRPTLEALGDDLLSAIRGLAPSGAGKPPWGEYDLSEGLMGGADHGL